MAAFLARPPTYDPAAFIANARAVQQGYLTSDPYAIEQAADFDPRVFLLADEGYPSYAAMVLAPNAFARDNAAALRRFGCRLGQGFLYSRPVPARQCTQLLDAF